MKKYFFMPHKSASSPYINHFLQPDTIIPDYTNPQSWNRYAYVMNSPIGYNDPTGHSEDCGIGMGCVSSYERSHNSGQRAHKKGQGHGGGGDNSDESNTCIINCSGSITIGNYSVNDWIWDNIPSAFGIHGGVSGQGGATIEPGVTPAEFLLLFNWRSGEVSWFYSFEGFVYIGTPDVFAGNLYGGWTTVKGLSRNQFYEGPSLFLGLAGSLDGFAKLGGILVNGKAITAESASKGEIPPTFFVDPISQRPVEYHQASIAIGGNIVANAFDVGAMGGPAWTTELTTISIPFWPIGR